MAANGGGEEKSCSVTSSSPKNRVKFLCSHGGKILPRPADGKLKYVGGETRLVVVPRDINFSELMNKLFSLFGGNKVLKYQLIPEELDALVSVTNNDDLRYMLDEYDRHTKSIENGGFPNLRAFLFPSDPETAPTTVESCALEQRYIDAINGLVRTTTTNTSRPIFGIGSPCGSSRRGMHRVQSSPSDLYNLGHHHQNQHNHQHHHAPLYSRFQDPYNVGRTGQRVSLASFGPSENGRTQMGHFPLRYYYSPSRIQNGGIGCGHDDGECTFFRSN